MLTDNRQLVLIFGHGRSGTSTFCSILAANKYAVFIREPFNHDTKHSPNYYEIAKTSLPAAVAALQQHATGYKHLKHQLQKEYNLELLAEHKTILMWRRNLLQTAVSIELAITTGAWKTKPTYLKPLRLTAIIASINRIGAEMAEYRRFMQKFQHKEVVYEDFYINSSFNDQKSFLNEVIDFVGTDPNDYDWAKIAKLLSHSNKLNTDYTAIPNYHEIAELGCAETGYL